jgi:NADH-quinone oxidoreductase subunit N
MRLYAPFIAHTDHTLPTLIVVVAIASMFIGNLLALLQQNVKRLLAYSSISHMGYFLVAFLSNSLFGTIAAAYYISAYVVTVLCALGVLTLLSGGREMERLEEYRGLAGHRPMLTALFTLAFLSLAGIPLTGGFIGKFYVLAAGVRSDLWLLALSLIVSSTIGLFYYLRVILALYQHPAHAGASGAAGAAPGLPRLPVAGSLAVAVSGVLLLWLGLYPGPPFELIRWLLSR